MAEIANELNTIRNGRYGIDIRDAIHDAIDKINTQVDEQNAGEEVDDAGHQQRA